MSLPPRFLDQLRDRLTLSEIVGRRVRLTRAGREFKGCCPFHKEKTPSFYVNDDKQFFHCFGCGAHGDAIGFVTRHDNLSFIEAVEQLAAAAGMEVPKESPQEIERQKQEKDLYSLLDTAARFFEDQLRLSANADALDYLKKRGLREDTIAAFRLGFAPADGQALRRVLKSQGYDDARMIETGVLHAGRDGREPYAFFRDRIIFPVSDRRGRVVAFGGRILPEHLRPPARGDYKPPKYINSAENPLFHKGKNLYAQAQARRAAADGKTVIVVEGNVDVIAAHQAGFTATVAPLGTALTEEQILEIWKMIPSDEKLPVLCFDGDSAGRRAAARAAERILPLLGPDRSVRIAFLPDGEDPDSLILGQGKKAFESVISEAFPLVDFLWNAQTAGRGFDTPESRAGLSQRLEAEALKIADREVQTYYRQAFRERIRAAFFTRQEPRRNREWSGGGRTPANGRMPRPAFGAPAVPPSVRLQRPATRGAGSVQSLVLLAALLNHPEIFAQVEDRIGDMDMGNETFDRLLHETISALQGDSGLDTQALCRHLDAAGFSAELSRVLSETVYVHAGFARPGTDTQDALKGWLEMRDFMARQGLVREIREAGTILAGEFTTENENRLQALHGMKATKER